MSKSNTAAIVELNRSNPLETVQIPRKLLQEVVVEMETYQLVLHGQANSAKNKGNLEEADFYEFRAKRVESLFLSISNIR